jgi:hypothetical protein
VLGVEFEKGENVEEFLVLLCLEERLSRIIDGERNIWMLEGKS